MSQTVYVSLTGFRLKSWWRLPAFIWHVRRSLSQANRSSGIIKTQTRFQDGIFHTISVWADETAMRSFVYTGAHREAIKAMSRLGSGKVYGFITDAIPKWQELHKLLNDNGRQV